MAATSTTDVAVVPLEAGTLLLDRRGGALNLLDRSGLPVRSDGGVKLPAARGGAVTRALAAGDLAYVLRSAASSTDVFLVGRSTFASGGAQALPRGVTALPSAVAEGRGDAAVSGTDLWVLTGTGARRGIRAVRAPTGSGQADRRLEVTPWGEVLAPAAVVASEGAGPVVLSRTGVSLLGGRERRDVPAAWSGDVDAVLPASGGQGAGFLVHRRGGGWSLAVVDPGSGSATLSPPVSAWGEADRPAPPVRAGGHWWTVTTRAERPGTAQVWRVEPDGRAVAAPGAAEYPLIRRDGRAVEAGDLSDVVLTARQDRVLVNSRSHVRALTLFADGGRAPAVIEKASAVSLDAAGQAAALIAPSAPGPGPSAPAGKPSTAPTRAPVSPAPAMQVVDSRRRCRDSAQVPHVPTITAARTTSRTLTLRWAYPVLDPADCLPSSYLVQVRPEAGPAATPGDVRVQGQTGVVVAGLFPATGYRVVVTALLGARSTASAPVRVTTGPEGPARPATVTVRAAGREGWRVEWTSCGGRPDCVPSDAWTVTPSWCDGAGVSAMPEPVVVAGDPSSSRFSTVYPVPASMLGRSLTFSVSGAAPTGEAGDAGRSACVASWAAPDVSGMTLTASAPGISADASGTSSTTLTLDLGPGGESAAGGRGAMVRFELLRRSRVVARSAWGRDLQVSLDGLQPGLGYEARALISPPGHPEVVATLGPVPVERARAAWPALQLQAWTTPEAPGVERLRLRWQGLSSRQARGQRFRLVDSSLICGNAVMPLVGEDVDPGQELSFRVDTTTFHGTCAVEGSLGQVGGDDGNVFGPSPVSAPARSGPVTLAVPDFPGLSASDLLARWAPVTSPTAPEQPSLSVEYRGQDPLLSAHPGQWRVEVSRDGGRSYDCGTVTAAPAVVVPVQPRCLSASGTPAWRVRVVVDWFGTAQPAVGPVTVAGTPPSPSPSPSPSASSG
ncbi:MAG: fibronectin type III domain-containing protein [Kineosporiaceae bacterium]